MDYPEFLRNFDQKLAEYFSAHKNFVRCKKGCSMCCKNGEYQISELELKYLMQGFMSIDDNLKIAVQKNFHIMQKGGVCPFLVNNECSVYDYRPVVCRVHGLAYLKDNVAIVPFCANSRLNYAEVYKNGEIQIEPIKENLDTPTVLKGFDYGEIRSLFDWLK